MKYFHTATKCPSEGYKITLVKTVSTRDMNRCGSLQGISLSSILIKETRNYNEGDVYKTLYKYK
jgi:hypothetical protein